MDRWSSAIETTALGLAAVRCFGGAKCVTYAQTGRWDRPDVNCPYLADGEKAFGGMHEK